MTPGLERQRRAAADLANIEAHALFQRAEAADAVLIVA
jgi:hypothetical protein